MVRVKFSSRILCDFNFMKWMLSHQNKNSIYSRMLRIKGNSEEHKGEHSVMLDFDFKETLSKNITEEHFIRGCVREVTTPKFLNDVANLFEKRIMYAIWLANESPFNTYIFSSPDCKERYEEIFTLSEDGRNTKNPYIKKMSFVKVKAGDDALEIIDNFYKQFLIERQIER